MTREQLVLEGALRARCRGEAAEDILARAADRFDDDPTPTEIDTWLDEQRADAPHLFVPSVGGDSAGSRRVRRVSFDPNLHGSVLILDGDGALERLAGVDD